MPKQEVYYIATEVFVGDKWQFTFVSRQGGQNGLNVKYFQVDAVTGIDRPIQAFIDVVSAAAAGLYIPLLASQANYRGLVARELGTLLPQLWVSGVGTGPGTAVGDPLPPQTCGLITVRGAGAARRNHGRIYIPFPAEDDNAVNGGISVTYATRAGNLGSFFVDPSTFTMPAPPFTVNGRWYIAGNRGTGIPVYIVSRQVRGFWGTQRRRSLLNRSDLVII